MTLRNLGPGGPRWPEPLISKPLLPTALCEDCRPAEERHARTALEVLLDEGSSAETRRVALEELKASGERFLFPT